jgi:hypothetical protein
LFFSAALKGSGTVNAKVMQDKSFASSSSATYSCSGRGRRGLHKGVIPSGIASRVGVGLMRSTLA